MRVRESAERLLQLSNPFHFDWQEIADPAREVASAWLAEHPVDDEEPVTLTWLGYVDQACTKRLSFVIARRDGWLIQWAPQCGDLDPIISLNEMTIITKPTRGDIRRLYRVLGIE